MAEKLNDRETVDFKEALMSEIITSEALINILERKGILTKQELLEEMMRVKASIEGSRE